MKPTIHIPVLANEVLEWLQPSDGQTMVDGTLGGGGHARLLAAAVGESGRVVGVDRDPEAIVDWSYLTGRKGKAVTRLMPSGKAKIDGRVYDVMTDGRVVDKGDEIEVVEATGNRVIVGPLESNSADSDEP